MEGGGGLSQLSEEEVGEGEGGSSIGGAGGAQQLAALLAAAADATGALAAMDAAQYVSGLALQQCRRVRQQHCAELAAFQWVNEHLLPPEAAAATAGLVAAVELSAAAAGAAGAALPPLHPAVASWALRGSRRQLLEQLQAGSGTLLSLQAPLQQWEAAMAAAQQQVAGEVAATAPYAAAQLQHHLHQQQHWLAAAAGHAAYLLEASQAVLQFEAARTADTQDGAHVGPGQLQPAADRYQVEQREGWRRYATLVRHMQQLHGNYAAAERRLAMAASELEQLRQRRAEATSIMQSAEAAGSSAAAAFAAAALPLVHATQQLPTAVGQVLPLLAGCADWEGRLRLAQHWVGELADVGAAAVPAAAAAADEAAERLAAAAGCLRELPAAVAALQAALLPVRNKLLAGGRGEAAAKQQAAQVVDALSAAVAQLQPQVRGLLYGGRGTQAVHHSAWTGGLPFPLQLPHAEVLRCSAGSAWTLPLQLDQAAQVQRWLAALPTSLQALAAQAAQQAEALQEQHGFSLHGLEQLLQGQAAGTPPASAPSPAAARGTLTGGLMLVPAAPSRRHGLKQEEQRQYAATLLQRFRAKLLGQRVADKASAGGSGNGATAVPAAVRELIAAATAPANLARMYEGWMPWV